MPTTPPQGLLEREIQKANIREILEETEPVLKEIIHYGLNLYARCSSTTGRGDENLPILLSYLHLLEMMDALQVLISEASVIPSRLQLRSMFEAFLTIEYIVQTDSIRRAYAFLVTDINERLTFYKSHDPNTPESKKLAKIRERDKIGVNVPILEFPDLSEKIEALEELLSKPPWCDTQAEYLRIKKKKKGKPRWYEFYDGPVSLEQLALKLDRGFQYEILYRPWSKTAHVDDIIRRQVLPGEGGEGYVRGLRNTNEILQMISFAMIFALGASWMVLGHYRPAEEKVFATWYIREVRSVHRKLNPTLPPLEEMLGF